MALTQISSSSSATGGGDTNQKQICASSQTSGAVIYTVPAGKIFVGYAGHERAGQGQGYYAEIISADGGIARHYGGFSAFGASQRAIAPSPVLTLLAGTSVKNQGGSNYCSVMGVESDA
tara:strand:- start:737 stop:1093 length:357 start_codon:yes stop_codon:yes gene_type:complete